MARQQTRGAKPPARRNSTAFTCAADLGTGVASRRRFCDVIVASVAADSVTVTIPPHTGAATLSFDLHNRFSVPAGQVDAAQAFAHHVAVVAVIRQTGDVIDRAAVARDYRSPSDLFDRISGSARGAAPKAVAPGAPQAVRVTIPAGVGAIGIVGTRLEEWRPAGRGAFDSPGRAIAIVSNVRVEYHAAVGPAQRMIDILDVVIIGGGPVGLAAAIAARTRGLSYVVLEKGALVNSLLHYPTYMVFFTTPDLMEIGDLPFVSPHDKPTRQEALRYYRRAADRFDLDIALGERVVGLTKGTDGKFAVMSEPAAGGTEMRRARCVVIATGAYDVPNRLGVRGEDLPHVSHYHREAHAYYRQRVVVVGGKNSAAEAALELHRAGAHVLIVHRGSALAESIKYWIKPDLENRIKEGAIRVRFNTRVVEITPADVVLDGPDGRTREPAGAVLLLTGYRSDPILLRQAGARLDDATGAPVHDEATFETTVPGLFVIGAAIAGIQSGRIFIENGRFHGEVAMREIAARVRPGDHAAG